MNQTHHPIWDADAAPICTEGSRILKVALAVFAILLVGHAASLVCLYHLGLDYGLGIVPLFNFDREANLPTVFAGILLAGAGFLALSIARWHNSQTPRSGRHWRWMGLILIFLALDECAHIHENLDYILMPRVETTGALAWPWVIPYLVLVVAVGSALAKFYLTLPKATQIGIAVSGTLFVGGAIGMEMVGANFAQAHGEDNLRYSILYTIEETMEFTGVLVLLHTLFRYAEKHAGKLVALRAVTWKREAAGNA